MATGTLDQKKGLFILNALGCYLPKALKDFKIESNTTILVNFHRIVTFDNKTHLFDLKKKDVVYKNTMEYYSSIKKNEIFPFAMTYMKLENIMLSEISHSEKDKYHTVPLICGIKEKNR